MGAGAGDIHAEGAVCHAGGDALFHGPVDGGLVPCAGSHIGEGVGSGGLGLIQVAPQEGDSLGAVGDTGRIELVGGDATGDVVFYGRGAGTLPTASAVLADVVDAAKANGAVIRVGVNSGSVEKHLLQKTSGRILTAENNPVYTLIQKMLNIIMD